ncbi:MAG: DinB family protein [Flavobacteriia bacterium]
MKTKELLIKEFEHRLFNESYERIFKCLSMIEERDLWRSPVSTIPPIGNLILHLCGNARQWILSGLGDKLDNRDRDQEFVIQSNIKKSELIFLLQNLRVNLRQTILDIDPKVLDKNHSIQGFEVTGFSMLIHVIEHFSYHTGQITTLTKWLTNKETDFYGDIDLNQLNKLN